MNGPKTPLADRMRGRNEDPRTSGAGASTRVSIERQPGANLQFQNGLFRPVGGCSVPFCLSGAGARVNFSGCAAIDFG